MKNFRLITEWDKDFEQIKYLLSQVRLGKGESYDKIIQISHQHKQMYEALKLSLQGLKIANKEKSNKGYENNILLIESLIKEIES